MNYSLGALGETILRVITNALGQLIGYLPQFIGGLIILIIGLILASLAKSAVLRLTKLIQVEKWFKQVGIGQARPSVWTEILAELARWSVVILFLVPSVEAWGLPRVTEVLNQFLLYLPNVFVAVVIAFIGLVIASLASDVVKNAASGMGSQSSNFLATTARFSIIFFTILIVLNQLGVAADLVRILFTGIVAMLAIAGGLAFGLGGQSIARQALEQLRKKVEEQEERARK